MIPLNNWKQLACLLLIQSLQTSSAWSPTSRALHSNKRRVTVATFSSSEALSFEAPGSTEAATTTVSLTNDENNDENDDITTNTMREQLTRDLISKLRFRELHAELLKRNLPMDGTTSTLRERLRQHMLSSSNDLECVVSAKGEEECISLEQFTDMKVTFTDDSKPDREIKYLIEEIETSATQKHWKTATRKLKQMTRRYKETTIDESVYLLVLEACMANRMQGARASEPARKILEQMVEAGYSIPEKEGNYCIQNSIGMTGTDSTHQGFGGLDTALAMLGALKEAKTNIKLETYERIVTALAKEGSIDHAMELLRNVVADRTETPPLNTFAAVANACIPVTTTEKADQVMSLLAYTKAAGYNLDDIASSEDGRSILASGVIAAERLGNAALGLRLLTAASKAQDCEPDKGDVLVALHSSDAQRACTRIHKRAIVQAVEDGSQWKLAVRLLELMLERGLRPSNWIWRNVVTCCAKAEKSKKSTALLMDWITLSEDNKADKPPLSVFNSVINTCEICGEQDLTLLVLDAMKKTHNTDGNLITFNIALKRLAKSGNYAACEGIIIGMLQSKIEPSVVSYTTAIAACVSGEVKQPQLAYEWIKRMRARKVFPNVITYNTAIAACLDGKLESSMLASKLAAEMVADVDRQLVDEEAAQADEYTDVVPNAATKMLARQAMEQLKENWKSGDIEKREATDTIRVPLRQLIDFQKTEAAQLAREKYAQRKLLEEDQALATSTAEAELDYSTAQSVHRTAEV
ncbi:hypothetical protein MPSEU_000196000 [Mayamaea pseudoterrestris]|nr:hypothetical protein MPSEU_000196000 [Mayamaea pseudoterrestris]